MNKPNLISLANRTPLRIQEVMMVPSWQVSPTHLKQVNSFYIVNELHYQNTKSLIKSLTYVFSTTFHRFVSILLDLDKFPIS